MSRDSLNSNAMKPKTPYQKRIVELNKTVRPLPEEVIVWAKEYALHHPAVRRKNNVTVCAICGNAMVYSGTERNVKCLECGRHVQIIESETWKAIKGNIKGWFSTLEVIDGIQLQRTFEIRCRYYLDGRDHQYYIRELSRHWLSPQGEFAITALPRMMGQFLDCFPLVGKIELRGTSQMVYDYIVDNSELYPDLQLIPPLSELTYEDIHGTGSQSFIRDMIALANGKQ